MTVLVGGFGTIVQVRASVTYPAGINITQLADDVDPVDIPSIQIADKAMGVNGDMIAWSKANPIPFNLGVIPNSQDDKNLQILLEANRVGKGKFPALDIITIVLITPDQRKFTFTQGVITDGMPANAISSAQRLKSKVYSFAFENVTPGI